MGSYPFWEIRYDRLNSSTATTSGVVVAQRPFPICIAVLWIPL
jgi:hypothetical protein